MKPKIIKADKGKYFFFSGFNGKAHANYVWFSEDGLMSLLNKDWPDWVVTNFQEISKAQYCKFQREIKQEEPK